LEALVFSQAAAATTIHSKRPDVVSVDCVEHKAIPESDSIQIRRALRKNATDHAGIVRSNTGLATGSKTVDDLLERYDDAGEAPFSPHPLETRNLLVACQRVFEGARRRTSNVGLHYNIDLA
jgi:aspartate oxidase